LDLDREFAEEQLIGFKELQIRLRPRALMTTLYARGVLSQAFLHGIGGALYDQMTDRLARAVWDWTLPNYAIATATLHLAPAVTEAPAATEATATTEPNIDQRRLLQRHLRDLKYSPERVPGYADRYPQWVADKRGLLAQIPLPKRRFAWQQQMERLLQDARGRLVAETNAATAQLARLDVQLQELAMMRHREWSFVLFDQQLPAELQSMARQASGV
jgi:hypothetical protein